MLRDKILPTGIGHTTNCFLQVEGSDSSDDACIYTPESDIPQNIKDLNPQKYSFFKKILGVFGAGRPHRLTQVECTDKEW